LNEISANAHWIYMYSCWLHLCTLIGIPGGVEVNMICRSHKLLLVLSFEVMWQLNFHFFAFKVEKIKDCSRSKNGKASLWDLLKNFRVKNALWSLSEHCVLLWHFWRKIISFSLAFWEIQRYNYWYGLWCICKFNV
jgi:hypothetical protein